MKIVVCVTGGIAAYKTASLVSALKQRGDEVQVIMTKHSAEFITPLTFKTLSKRDVITDMFEEQNAEFVGHIHYGQEWDAIIVAPATANTIGKVVGGIADNMVTSTIIASTVPVIFVPSMNTHMYENPIVQNNMNALLKYGYHLVEPESGMLACGIEGKGKLPKTETIINKLDEVMKGEKS